MDVEQGKCPKEKDTWVRHKGCVCMCVCVCVCVCVYFILQFYITCQHIPTIAVSQAIISFQRMVVPSRHTGDTGRDHMKKKRNDLLPLTIYLR
jgi:hypothetical protein